MNKIYNYNPSKREQEVTPSVFISLFFNPYFLRISFNKGKYFGEKIYCPRLTQSAIDSAMRKSIDIILENLE